MKDHLAKIRYRIVPQGMHSEPLEGMARVIGTGGFVMDPLAVLCWHCNGDKKCCCASCLPRGEAISAQCGACKGAGLLVFQGE